MSSLCTDISPDIGDIRGTRPRRDRHDDGGTIATVTRALGGEGRPRRWGTASALLDDDEARRRLVAAAVRCIVRSGTGRISMDEVADEAGVSRATVYRYYRTREDLILGVVLSRLDQATGAVIRSLEEPGNAARSIPELIALRAGLLFGDAVSEALFPRDGRPLVAPVELASDPVVEGVYRRIAPLLRQWQDDGQLSADLDLRMTARWLNLVSVTLTTSPWLEMPDAEKRAFLDAYVVRALVNRDAG
jgi:AcrR family transcriptional regulator